MSVPETPCANHRDRIGLHRMRARYWWGWGPELDFCGPCRAAFLIVIRARERRTGYAIRVDCCPTSWTPATTQVVAV
jgi:hypothetical protein